MICFSLSHLSRYRQMSLPSAQPTMTMANDISFMEGSHNLRINLSMKKVGTLSFWAFEEENILSPNLIRLSVLIKTLVEANLQRSDRTLHF